MSVVGENWIQHLSEHAPYADVTKQEHVRTLAKRAVDALVRDNGGRPPTSVPPDTLRGLQQGGLEDVEILTYCLKHARNKAEQLDALNFLPTSLTQAKQLFSAGYDWADMRCMHFGRVKDASNVDPQFIHSFSILRLHAYRQVALGTTGCMQNVTMQTLEQFFTRLKANPCNTSASSLTEGDRLVLTRHVYSYKGNGSLLALADWGMRIKSEIGNRAFRVLFGHTNVCPSDLVVAAQLTAELYEGQTEIRQLLKDIPSKLSITSYVHECKRLQAQEYVRKFPEKLLDSVLEQFQNCKDVDVMLPADDIQKIGLIYTRIKEMADTLLSATNEYIISTATTHTKNIKRQGGQHAISSCTNDSIAILACLKEAMRRFFHISPYNTQMCAILGILMGEATNERSFKGRLAQVKTGEGKSTIVTILAGFLALTGRYVDVISSSEPLSYRDWKKYKPFYDFFGIGSRHACGNEPEPGAFDAHIVYGTNFNFEFAILRDGLYNRKSHFLQDGTPRPFDAVIVDEVDNLFIDKGSNSAIMSVPAPDSLMWIVPAIAEFYEQNKEQHTMIMLQKLCNSLMGLELSTLPTTLQFPELQLRSFLEKYQDGQYKHTIAIVSDDDLNTWLASCQRAHTAYTEGRDYVLGLDDDASASSHQEKYEKKIQIVDRHTGDLQKSSRWGQRLHQFIEYKHKLKIQPENLTAAEMSHPVYFNNYTSIFGLTGTIGSTAERQEVSVTYNVDSFDVPPHKPNNRIELEPVICGTEEDYFETIISNIREMQFVQRPTLVLVPDINASLSLSKYLTSQSLAHQVLNGTETEDRAFIVSRAGQNAVVTIATNTAGRGTDILLAKEPLAAGGLHVILGFYAENSRIEAQGIGRAARQGQRGSSKTVVLRQSLSQRMLAEMSDGSSGQALINKLDIIREEEVLRQSRHRLQEAILCLVNNEFLKKYFECNNRLQAAIAEDRTIEALVEALLTKGVPKFKSLMSHISLEVFSAAERLKNSASSNILQSLVECFQKIHDMQDQGRVRQMLKIWVQHFGISVHEKSLGTWALFFHNLTSVKTKHSELHPPSESFADDAGISERLVWEAMYREQVAVAFDEAKKDIMVLQGESAHALLLSEVESLIAQALSFLRC